MRTAARVVLLAAGLTAGAWAFGGQTDTGVELEAARTTFASALADFRRDADGARERLEASTETMARLGRTDLRAVVAFYAALPAAERKAGLSAEREFEALYAESVGADRRDHAQWPAQRERILKDLDAVIAERRASPDPTPAARCLSLAAMLEEQRARADASLGTAERDALLRSTESRARDALKIFESAGLVTPTLQPLWLLARVDDARGDLADAQIGFEDCLDLAEQVAVDDYRVRALRGLVAVAAGTGDLAAQRGLMREIAAIREPKDDWWLAHSWSALLVAEDEPEAALRFLEGLRPVGLEQSNQWHSLCASALQRLDRFDEAERHMSEVRLVAPNDDGVACAQVEARVSDAQMALKRHDAARSAAILEPLSDAACAASTRAQRSLTLGAAYLQMGDAARAEAALRTGLELGRAIEARLARSDDGAVFGEIVGLETFALLADALTQQGRPLEAVRVAEEFQARVLRGRDDTAITEDDLRTWAAGFERGLVTWVVGADTTVCAHVAANGEAIAAVVQLGRERLEEAIRRTREAAIAGDDSRARRLAREIESRIVPAVLRERVEGDGRLLVLAHGPLERLPFDLLSIRDGGSLAVLPGLASARPGETPPRTAYATWSILGDPSSAEGRSLLPGARAEVTTIAKSIGATAKTGEAFDRLALIDALKSGLPLHVATHLVQGCGDGAHEAGLLTAHGALLCAREIRELKPSLPLAVLAACETAEGRFVDAQALVSVSNAFLASGTRNLCVTLWPVEDGAARRWSEAFHAELARGTRPADAARHASDVLQREGTSVSEWAAFRFVGRD